MNIDLFDDNCTPFKFLNFTSRIKNLKSFSKIKTEIYVSKFNTEDNINRIEMFNLIKQHGLDLLSLYNEYKDDKQIVLESLKHNPEMICFSNVKFINKYVECEFDMNKTIYEIENNLLN